MSKIDMPKTSLLTEFFYYDIENYGHKLNQIFLFCYDIFKKKT